MTIRFPFKHRIVCADVTMTLFTLCTLQLLKSYTHTTFLQGFQRVMEWTIEQELEVRTFICHVISMC